MLVNLQKIDSALSKTKLSGLEKKRLNKDLVVVQERILKREYLHRDFATDNKFNIPDRTKDFFRYLDSYCLTGKTISKVLNALKVNKYASVVDLCSGWAPKVTLWLFYSQYSWKLILLDKDKKSTTKLINFMKLFNPSYKLEKQSIDLFWDFDFKSDFIVANHVIDDLIISYFSQEYNYKVSNIYESENNLLKCRKNILLTGDDFKQKVSTLLCDLFDKMVLNNGIIILTQYQSMIEYLLNLNEVTTYNKDVLYEVKKLLLETWKYVDLSHISFQVLKSKKEAFSASECIILKKK